MANISTIKVGNTSYGITATPTAHASTATTYGAASASNYGHVKLSDNYTSSAGTAASGIGASSAAVYNAYNTLNSNLSKNYSRRYDFVNSGSFSLADGERALMFGWHNGSGGKGCYVAQCILNPGGYYTNGVDELKVGFNKNALSTPTMSNNVVTLTNGVWNVLIF